MEMNVVKTHARRVARRAPARREQDATAFLKTEHRRLEAMCKEFNAMKGAGKRKQALAERICDELSVHMQMEEEIFFPAVRRAIEDDPLMDEAEVEHETFKTLIAEIRGMQPGDDHYDAKVKVLAEYMEHHHEEEEDDMFPAARDTALDLKALGAALKQRKSELYGSSADRKREQLTALMMSAPF